MQQSIFTAPHESIAVFPQYNPFKGLNESKNSLNSWQINNDDQHKHLFQSINNWEYFMNELEYE